LRILIQETFTTDVSLSLIWVGVLVWLPALLAAAMMPETYGRDLNFEES
jgi:hypothetical protein